MLFEASHIELKDASVAYFHRAFTSEHADTLLETCISSLPRRQDSLLIAGRHVVIPRLQNWFGNSGAHYSYSGFAMHQL
jgi:hypothetical protein